MNMLRHDLGCGGSVVTFGGVAELIREIPTDSLIITDENVFQHWGHAFSDWSILTLPPGEKTKSFEYFERTIDRVANEGVKRSTTLVALGGGVIGDLAGFVAATYMRGVPLIQFPTTLLAQVDSSVGGKVGIDLAQGKNLLGSFYHPKKILIAAETLTTLDIRQLRNGLAEVWKYGFIMDSEFVDELKRETDDTKRDFSQIALRCIKLKESVVAADEFDLSGRRAILNFGHTVGHALEGIQNYEGLLHGEAVAVGMAVEAKLGEIIGITEAGTTREIVDVLKLSNLPTSSDDLTRADELLEFMGRDKKATGKGLSFSLLEGLGTCKLVENVPADAVREALLSA
ncbi:MAG: 3-dehydroquinate synthase [Fimbriimonadaceae bacterium]|nr:3-dehydroquinate synthase [Fimbriimonadaceae bacterium]